MHLWEKMGDMGLLGITAPEEYGGLGRTYLDHVLIMEEVRASSLFLVIIRFLIMTGSSPEHLDLSHFLTEHSTLSRSRLVSRG